MSYYFFFQYIRCYLVNSFQFYQNSSPALIKTHFASPQLRQARQTFKYLNHSFQLQYKSCKNYFESHHKSEMRRTTVFKMFSTYTKFCIIGGGTGGLNLSAHLLKAKVLPKHIRVFDASQKHYYQPGWTMVGGSLCKSELTYRNMKDVLPKQINHTKKNVTKIQPDKKLIHTKDGETFTYDQLIVASGLTLHWQKIKGSKEALDDPNSKVASIYYLPYAQKMARLGHSFKGGKAIFTQPPTPIKCAGAPQKILYLWTDKWRKAGIKCQVEFLKAPGVMFSVPKYAQALTKVAQSYDIKWTFHHNLIEIKDNLAIFQNLQTKQTVERKFDLLHMVPPMGPHKYIAESGLGDAAGYLEVDKYTLRHIKYPNIWGLGDCSNTPNSKTAAAVFSQTQTLLKNLLAAERNPDAKLPSKYEGYASCPLFVGGGKLMLAEFKYDLVVDETFFSDQEKPRRMFYYLKRYGFPHIYWNLVPRGIWGGRQGIKISI